MTIADRPARTDNTIAEIGEIERIQEMETTMIDEAYTGSNIINSSSSPTDSTRPPIFSALP